MNIDFPNNPTIGQIYTYSGRSWQWNGFAWDIFGTSGNVVSQLNGFTGNVNLAGGSSISVSNSGNTITISYTGTGGGGAGISGPYVISFNGLTGAVTGVTTGVANTFIPLQTFAAGISAAGATFNKPVTIKGQTAGGIFYVDALQGFVIEGLAGTPYVQLFKTAGNYIYLSDNDLLLQNTNGVVFIGDGDNQVNGTNITVHDDQGTINMYSNVPGIWNWDNPGGRIDISSGRMTLNAVERITLNGLSLFPSGISSAGATFSRNISAPNMVDSLKGWFFL